MSIGMFLNCLLVAGASFAVGWGIGSTAALKYWNKLMVKLLQERGFNKFYIDAFINDLRNLNNKL